MPENQLETVPQASQQIIDAAKRESHAWLNPETWRTMQLVAATFLQSGAMPASMNSAPKLMVALQAGKEAGMQPMEAINSFYFVNGKVSIYGELAIAQVLRAGHTIKWGKCDEKEASIKIIRGDGKGEFESRFTIEMAKAKNLIKNAWVSWPENMLRFKAFHLCARFIVPDALHGTPVKELEEAEEAEEVKIEHPVVKQMEICEEDLKKPIKPGMILRGKPEESLEEALAKPKEEVVIEVMPPEEKKTESKAAKTMREAKEKNERENDKGLWPDEVCTTLQFIDSIPDADLPPDIIQLRKDSNGKFKGYEAYPGLADFIKTLPEEVFKK